MQSEPDHRTAAAIVIGGLLLIVTLWLLFSVLGVSDAWGL